MCIRDRRHCLCRCLEFMRAETKPPGGFDISPEIPAAFDSMAIFRTLCDFASEQSGKFGLELRLAHNSVSANPPDAPPERRFSNRRSSIDDPVLGGWKPPLLRSALCEPHLSRSNCGPSAAIRIFSQRGTGAATKETDRSFRMKPLISFIKG